MKYTFIFFFIFIALLTTAHAGLIPTFDMVSQGANTASPTIRPSLIFYITLDGNRLTNDANFIAQCTDVNTTICENPTSLVARNGVVYGFYPMESNQNWDILIEYQGKTYSTTLVKGSFTFGDTITLALNADNTMTPLVEKMPTIPTRQRQTDLEVLLSLIIPLALATVIVLFTKLVSEFIILHLMKKRKRKILLISAIANLFIPAIALFTTIIIAQIIANIFRGDLLLIIVVFVLFVIIATALETVLLKLLNKNELSIKEACIVSVVGYVLIGILVLAFLIYTMTNTIVY